MSSQLSRLTVATVLAGLSTLAYPSVWDDVQPKSIPGAPSSDLRNWTESPVDLFGRPAYVHLDRSDIQGNMIGVWIAFMDGADQRFLQKMSINCATHKSVIVRMISLDNVFKENGRRVVDFPLGRTPQVSPVGSPGYTMEQFVCGVLSMMKQDQGEKRNAPSRPTMDPENADVE